MLFKDDKAARAQHQAVRENAGWYRWTHDLVEVRGKDAEKFLDRLFVGAITRTPVGRTKYTTMLNEAGKIIDDTIVMHMEEDCYWVSTLYAPQFIKWADAHKDGAAVSCEDITKNVDMYAVQGPKSLEIMNSLLAAPVDGMKRFAVADNQIEDVAVHIHRSGFTGELGYEVYCRIEDTQAVEDAIRVACERFSAPELSKYGITVNAICPGYTRTSIFGDAPEQAMAFFEADCPAGRMGDPRECAYLALFLASDMARYITGAAIPVDGALSAGHQNVTNWKHPELVTGGKLGSDSTIAAILESEKGAAVVEKYLPGFAGNEQAKPAYGMTFKALAPMLGLPEQAVESMLAELDAL